MTTPLNAGSISFKRWIESLPDQPVNVLDIRKVGEGWQAKLDGRGWLSLQWYDIPDNVEMPLHISVPCDDCKELREVAYWYGGRIPLCGPCSRRQND